MGEIASGRIIDEQRARIGRPPCSPHSTTSRRPAVAHADTPRLRSRPSTARRDFMQSAADVSTFSPGMFHHYCMYGSLIQEMYSSGSVGCPNLARTCRAWPQSLNARTLGVPVNPCIIPQSFFLPTSSSSTLSPSPPHRTLHQNSCVRFTRHSLSAAGQHDEHPLFGATCAPIAT